MFIYLWNLNFELYFSSKFVLGVAKLHLAFASDYFQSPLDFDPTNLIDGDWTAFQKAGSCYHSQDRNVQSEVLMQLETPAVIKQVFWKLRSDEYASGLGGESSQSKNWPDDFDNFILIFGRLFRE